MAWRIISPEPVALGGQGITEVSTIKRHDLGLIAQAVDPAYGGGEFIYLATSAAVLAKSWVTYNMDDGTVTALLANAIGPVAIAMADGAASSYGWFQIAGKALGLCLTLFADDGRVCATSTSFKVDDASVTGDLVANAKGASTTGVDSGYAEFEIQRPFVTDSLSTGG